MEKQNKINLLIHYKRQILSLKEAGFNADEQVIDKLPFPKYFIMYDSVELTMHTYDYLAYKHLLDHNLLNVGVCHHCGEFPISNDYKFINPWDNRLQYPICRKCWKLWK
jgi:hypothetical protein